MRRTALALFILAGAVTSEKAVLSQTSAALDPIIQGILVEGMERSELYSLAQTLMDSIGPRLTGSHEHERANDWAASSYRRWGVPVRTEPYGTWKAWRRGTMHLDLLEPRVRSLEGMLMTWSAGTKGPLQGPVVIFPDITTAAEFETWLPQARGRFVAMAAAEPTCRPDENWKTFATPDSLAKMQKERVAQREAWSVRLRATGLRGGDLMRRLRDAGAHGMLIPLFWPQAWSTGRMGTAVTGEFPEVALGCEDYGLLFRLAYNNQNPVLRVNADAEFLGEVPVSNVLAEIRGREKPHEYVVLSAHMDSWDAASGATDNGASTVAIMEAMRILWHTNRDTFDKLVFDDLKNNAVLLAMLAYLASEDPQRLAREPRVTAIDPKTGQAAPWPTCPSPARKSGQTHE